MESIGQNIKKIRLNKNMTQKQLGALCGMADSAIRRYENGGANPKIETLGKIAQALNVSIGDLDPSYSYMTHDKDEALKIISQLNQFIEKIPEMNASNESKKENIYKAQKLVEDFKSLVNIIDIAILADKGKKAMETEKQALIESIQAAEKEIEDMCLFVFRQLNLDGQEKVIQYAADIIQIPKYQKPDTPEE